MCVCVCHVTAEAVVAESVVVIKKLLQMQPKENKDLIVQVARLADRVQVTSILASPLSLLCTQIGWRGFVVAVTRMSWGAGVILLGGTVSE